MNIRQAYSPQLIPVIDIQLSPRPCKVAALVHLFLPRIFSLKDRRYKMVLQSILSGRQGIQIEAAALLPM